MSRFKSFGLLGHKCKNYFLLSILCRHFPAKKQFINQTTKNIRLLGIKSSIIVPQPQKSQLKRLQIEKQVSKRSLFS